ncbi:MULTISPECIES: flagellar basal body protein [Iodidimonas]|jgi:flagellar basal-body rod protein FlgB|uniref:Flagellar basal body rod protein FlgB n=1 Tax=Iodidimonas nitroreducens TaxID=1236968 RepID=A0A5A7N4Z0_9PROT|nr:MULTISPECIES: flagellar basal body protein [Iodidimonas]GAK32328.1 flagellar basal body rod protein FlgB [alpha proteobacterium Q-1]GER03331.1 flagellar basal body rod protein FlgB [Iodidimonas nitroreducens]
MLLDGIEVVRMAQMRLSYLSERHKLVASNVANADTPNFQTKDLKPFDQVIDKAFGMAMTTARTHADHLGPLAGEQRFALDRKADGWERAPAGNSVVLEQEMMKASQISGAYDLTSLIMGKTGDMMRTALSFRA